MASETSSIEKSESTAVVECRSGSPAPSVKSATSSSKKTKKAMLKTVVAAVAATQELESNLSGDHPYLSVLYKRIRSHRKKLEKIRTLEQAEGKVLNAQQLELMSTKSSLEKLVAELEMLREQFLGVYRLEEAQKLQEEASVAAVEEASVAAVEEAAVEDVVQLKEEVVQLKDEEKEVQEDFAKVFELLKTLHVVNLHQALGKEVPMVLDFFSKVLLGNTRPPAELSYEENLMESLEEAKKYLTESDKVFACDTTYSGLRVFVDQLASISSGKNEQEEVAGVDEPEETIEGAVEGNPIEAEEVQETSDVPVVPAEINTMPEISFFTESQLDEEQSDEIRAEVEQAEGIAVSDVVVDEVQVEPTEEINERSEGEIEEQLEVAVEVPPAPESIPAPPLSFAAVGVESERTPSPTTSSGSSTHEKEAGPEDNSSRGKNAQRRRGQGRWREKSSNSNSDNKAGNGSSTNGGKPRRPRGPRTNDENSAAPGGKLSGSKEGRRPRVDRALRKQGNPSQQHAAPMIAPHA